MYLPATWNGKNTTFTPLFIIFYKLLFQPLKGNFENADQHRAIWNFWFPYFIEHGTPSTITNFETKETSDIVIGTYLHMQWPAVTTQRLWTMVPPQKCPPLRRIDTSHGNSPGIAFSPPIILLPLRPCCPHGTSATGKPEKNSFLHRYVYVYL